MDNVIQINNEGEHAYDIIFSDSFRLLKSEIEKFKIENKRICIVTDSNVSDLYADEVKKLVDMTCKQCIVVQFHAGELSKRQETVDKIYEVLVKKKFDRKDILIALGGGVVGDITGFVAATYMRGIDFYPYIVSEKLRNTANFSVKDVRKEAKKALDGGSANWNKVGTMAVSAIQEFVRGDYYKTNIPNSKKTIEWKTVNGNVGDKPLIDTSLMINSLSFIVQSGSK